MREPYLDIFDSYHYCAPYHELKVRCTYTNIERLRSNRVVPSVWLPISKVVTFLGFDPRILRSDTVESEGRQMKQRWIKYRNKKIPLFIYRKEKNMWREIDLRRSFGRSLSVFLLSSYWVQQSNHRPLPLRYQRRYFKTFKEPRNRFQGIDSACLCSLAGRRCDKPVLTRFLVPPPPPIDRSKILAQITLLTALSFFLLCMYQLYTNT
jgi:hypothetical protein